MTGGLIASRLTDMPGASDVFRGSVVSYASEVKYDVLDVPDGPVVSAEAAEAMAIGACRVLGCDVAIAVTGVAGPDEQEGMPVGTVFLAIAEGDDAQSLMIRLPGDRARVRAVRHHLGARLVAPQPARWVAVVARLFIAVYPPPEVVASLAALPHDGDAGVRWVPPDQYHVTVRFLGSADVDDGWRGSTLCNRSRPRP